MVRSVVLGNSVPLIGRAMLPEWIYSQGIYFEPTAGDEVRIFGIYNNKQTNKQKFLSEQAIIYFEGVCIFELQFYDVHVYQGFSQNLTRSK